MDRRCLYCFLLMQAGARLHQRKEFGGGPSDLLSQCTPEVLADVSADAWTMRSPTSFSEVSPSSREIAYGVSTSTRRCHLSIRVGGPVWSRVRLIVGLFGTNPSRVCRLGRRTRDPSMPD
jgi:hypothetical protein